MKKIKRILPFVLAVVLCQSLCGCTQLDELRMNTANWKDDSHSEIVFRDAVYKKADGITLATDFYSQYNIAGVDVPLLLADFFGGWIDVNPSDKVICYQEYVNDDPEGIVWYKSVFYFREDCYDELMAAVGNLQFDHFGTSLWTDDKFELVPFPQELCDAMNAAIASGTQPTEKQMNNVNYYGSVYAYDKDQLSIQYVGIDGGEGYYLLEVNGSFLLVPEEYNSAVEAMFDGSLNPYGWVYEAEAA